MGITIWRLRRDSHWVLHTTAGGLAASLSFERLSPAHLLETTFARCFGSHDAPCVSVHCVLMFAGYSSSRALRLAFERTSLKDNERKRELYLSRESLPKSSPSAISAT